MNTLRKTLLWLARIYLGLLVLVIFVISPIGFVFFDPAGVGHGLGRLWATYSPFNYVHWLGIGLLVIPGLLVLKLARVGAGPPTPPP